MAIDPKGYAARLYARLGEAVLVPRVAWPGARPKECHTNVAHYLEADPTSKAVHGWLFESYPDFEPPFVRFWSHSVIETSDGRLIDITPAPIIPFVHLDTALRPFLREPDEIIFTELARAGVLHLDHYVSPRPSGTNEYVMRLG